MKYKSFLRVSYSVLMTTPLSNCCSFKPLVQTDTVTDGRMNGLGFKINDKV